MTGVFGEKRLSLAFIVNLSQNISSQSEFKCNEIWDQDIVVSNESENNFQIISVKKNLGCWMDLLLFENIRSCMSAKCTEFGL